MIDFTRIIDSIFGATDSYKYSHSVQYPKDMINLSAYMSSRGGMYDKLVFFGLQYVLKERLSKPITREQVDVAAAFATAHGEPFPLDMFNHILDVHGGKLPLKIWALPEGSITSPHQPLLVVESTDPKCASLVGFIEPIILRCWYPITVSSRSRQIKQIIMRYLTETADNPTAEIQFKLHDFGARGASSEQSSGIGGMAHLVNFMGTDTIMGALFAQAYYNMPSDWMAGYSIPAAEHSTITSWGRDHEIDAYRNMLDNFAKPGAILAVVSDSYDVFNAIENMWGGELCERVEASGATLVIRPDSGDPKTVVMQCLDIMKGKFKYTHNSKGYLVFDHVRIIQGDGVDEQSVQEILQAMKDAGYSASNIAFGMGGALLQGVNRDTCKFAYKASAMQTTDGQWHAFSKDPITDPGKKSHAGRVDVTGMHLVFDGGQLVNETTFNDVRALAM